MVSVMLYPCMFCVALLMDLFVLCVACLTVSVNCLVKQFGKLESTHPYTTNVMSIMFFMELSPSCAATLIHYSTEPLTNGPDFSQIRHELCLRPLNLFGYWTLNKHYYKMNKLKRLWMCSGMIRPFHNAERNR